MACGEEMRKRMKQALDAANISPVIANNSSTTTDIPQHLKLTGDPMNEPPQVSTISSAGRQYFIGSSKCSTRESSRTRYFARSTQLMT